MSCFTQRGLVDALWTSGSKLASIAKTHMVHNSLDLLICVIGMAVHLYHLLRGKSIT